MIPHGQESAYFSVYEISERGTSWIGPIVFGLAVQMTGSPRVSLLPLIAFFVIGMVLLATTIFLASRILGRKLGALFRF